ncbi:hypothetical protein CDD81_2573 [Ophiocordyceps australis]|uniref:Histidinol-phosphatase n=1 Tax=Ophiocordyceps australis TaxID=1399860 RepID=A0A2C5XWL5_9HYPO|nr:hypothetical protein CDD81_2573 [Ophiocordyceps australis]
MAFTMHSHSGQFCSHAVDQLEDIIRHAMAIGFTTMGLTEHMPRHEERDLYPEELSDAAASLAAMVPRHQAYLAEAQRLRAKYASSIRILIGFEAEYIRPSYGPMVHELALAPCIDYFIGSVHHVHGFPIDYDAASYSAAISAAGGSEMLLYQAYYDLQLQMLRDLTPRIIGHFDLIRLLSADSARDVRQWPSVWSRIQRNLALAAEQGAWIECNTSALRKGLAEPYPCRAIAEEWLRLGGKFTMSDDSHGIAHVATNYARGVSYLESLGVTHVCTFTPAPPASSPTSQEPTLQELAVPLTEFRKHL